MTRHRIEIQIQLRVAGSVQFLVEELLDRRYPENFGLLRNIGGKIENGESAEDALSRELREEYPQLAAIIRETEAVPRFLDQTHEADHVATRLIIELPLDDAVQGLPGTQRMGGKEKLRLTGRAPEPWVR